MTQKQINIRTRSIEEQFVEEIDAIYYPGYAEEISESDPERFQWELNEFKSQFSDVN